MATLKYLNNIHFQWPRYWLPYLFEPMTVAGYKHLYLPLNRQYKPLGVIPYDPQVNYEDYREHFVKFSRDPHTFTGVWIPDNRGYLYLYDDTEKNSVGYFERLERLCSYKMTMPFLPKSH